MKQVFKKLGLFLPILGLSLIPTLVIWLIFFLRLESFWTIPLPKNGMATIIANFDGPLYIVVAKTFYNAAQIKDQFSFPLPVEYYAAHFPLYPLLIRLVSPLIGYVYGSLFISTFASAIALIYFYKLASKLDKKSALWLTLVFSIFPARWLIVRSISSPEPLFLASILASIYYFKQKKYWLAALGGVLAQLTKSPGMLLFIGYLLYLTIPQLKKLGSVRTQKWLRSLNLRTYPLLLIPLALIGLFFFYGQVMGNFFAYFNSGDNIHLFFPPFQVFNYSATWVGTFWLEEIIFIYFFGLLGLMKLARDKKMQVEFWFVLVFFISIIFVSHRDVLRYALPITPFILIAFRDFLAKKEFKFILAFLVIPIFLFSLAYISQNVMPISDWNPLL